ncbi:MAG TPA: alpha/beta hydrolase [Clostridium sp.]|uniref:Alpha/beta hydrolase n=2 Tax=Acetivibrio mesophilus TaxID=2487273 RepID=A0A4Q0I211_9FIRM|nr:hypothetical protein A7W90_16770 [Clostridium sp. Bc-iso-3]RXE58181.1 alpha/beta hydrolase [Acetivibrio mesophilus]HHV30611.1 alpha/beta hydrolase [Clostridium sp.]
MRKVFALLILTIFVFVGCSTEENTEEPHETSEITKETVSNLELYNLEAPKGSKYQAVVTEFDLGKKEYLSKAGKIMPYNIRGIIGVPEGDGPFPLILITHGSHSNDDESKRFDTGFDYLVKDLAENGYIAVSMDMSKPYIWKYGDGDDAEKSIPIANDHIENLIWANEGNNLEYGVDLKGKIDFDKIALVGHSRGGETIFDITNDQARRGILIKALLSITPTALFEREMPDIDVAIIVSEYDGDVQLDGYNMYSMLNSKSKGLHFVTLLMKGNHNYFNRNIQANDSWRSRHQNVDDQLTREQQESFLVNYAVGFFNSVLLGNTNDFINANSPQPNKMYGFDVKTMYRTDKRIDLVDITTTDDFQAEGGVVEATVDSWFFKLDKVLIDTVTSGIEPFNIRPLINVKWTNKNSRVILSPKVQDFSRYEALTLNMVIDSADELNKKDASQQFTVELMDATGNLSRVVLPENMNALASTPGEMDYTPLEDMVLTFWSTASPISCINLPLGEFKNLDLEHIESISLIFDKTDSGSIFIDSITLQ